MAGVYDHLSRHLQDDYVAPMSLVDLVDLPETQKQIMLLLLRNAESTHEGMSDEALRAEFEGQVEHFEEALEQLARNRWLISFDEAPKRRYRVNLRVRRGSTTGFNLWSILTDRLPNNWKGTTRPDAT